ncbi:MAG: hypothetical protein CMI19_06945 [Opitutae bacterium]|nr:hypothetical protein [Opitutae bacterium]|tara:strand:+ start:30998 stop:31618 length:621 start_codon:yes stop_codon:yes gene_type:complete
MSDSEEQPSDEELSELIDDEENTVDSESGEPEGAVEVGIPPAVDDEGDIDSSEEMFSMDDFDSSEEVVDNPIEENIAPDEPLSEELAPVEEGSVAEESPSESSSKATVDDIPETNGAGGVAEFRKTLSNLSRQLEIDRLAFLHQAMKDRGEKVPTLSQIAADIQGTKPLAAKGDCDQYGGRPTARLEGWVSGLSFGASRRAKKFNK